MKIAKWFLNRLDTIAKHNNFERKGIQDYTVKECEKTCSWTPCDLILREWLNNGGGSAKGFLGITRKECEKCYDYIVANADGLIMMDMISKDGWNNCGCMLWTNWGF